ncbi:MAG: hypothetical protein AAF802_16625, partial [Planctomycetota bacterium]
MTRQIFGILSTMTLAFAGTLFGQSTNQSSQATPTLLAPSTNPLPLGIAFPQWYRTSLEKELETNGRDGDTTDLLRQAEVVEPTEANRSKAKEVLIRMATFLNAQNSASFTLEYELNQQETMGTVATGKNAFETFQFDFAKPNLIKASCTRE